MMRPGAARAHLREERARHGHQAEHVVSYCARMSASVMSSVGPSDAVAGVVDEHVDAAAAGARVDSVCLARGDRSGVGDVELDSVSMAAPSRRGLERASALSLRPAGEDTVAALGEVQRRVTADARGGAGDQDRLLSLLIEVSPRVQGLVREVRFHMRNEYSFRNQAKKRASLGTGRSCANRLPAALLGGHEHLLRQLQPPFDARRERRRGRRR